MEKIIHTHIVSCLESKNRLNIFQFGFCWYHFTVDLLLHTTHDMALALESHSSSHCLLLEFSKAFWFCPSWKIIIETAIVIRGKLLAWICVFLTCWVQRVVVNSSYSSWLPVRSGIPHAGICSWPPVVYHLC